MRRQIRENTVSLRGVMTIRKGGQTYRYLRIKGQPLVKLPDLPPDHPEFLAAYAIARSATPTRRVISDPGTIAALCEAAMRSEAYLGHSNGYRAILYRHINAIRAQAHDARAGDLRPEHIGADLAALPASVAQLRHKAWRFVCKYGKATGLLSVVEHFEVGALWMNRPWLYAAEILGEFHGNYTAEGLSQAIREAYPQLVELEKLAMSKGIPIREAFAFTEIGAFTVLSPTRARYLTLISQFDRTPESYAKPLKGLIGRVVEAAKALVRFFETWGDESLEDNPAPTSAANECSLIQLGKFGDRTVLLTADAGPKSLAESADIAQAIGLLSPPSFVQVPHHGSRRNVTPNVLNRWLGPSLPEGSSERGTAFCSVGNNKPQYPRQRVANAFLRRGYPVYKIPDGETTISHIHEMPARTGVPMTAIPFVSEFEE